ncbi:dTDP-4-dehydrorhamnose 3,5-epimerase [Aliiroseovarius sp. KMU-50]|uniref:dTDP-4-dehydrorhamnose 3,5-epimerase n=1 Tax=Aliiroseovarius salicola TaxID=3009082 RepID=A0ABT4VXT9_9RHOB|nr:dTDP-4-dehydrorhamnose 3,5-epimerase [Aliiroseovarius sp. KMU-50]MDA5093080.1 dTDP-4-dehydrorhamnose 3,5-epimerase [Aliiroseovarius sp. KMU-50]
MIEETTLSGVYKVTPPRYIDQRGFFSESWNRKKLSEAGLDLPDFVQDNHSLSHDIGTIRGLHFQSPPHAQGKLVRCGRGKIFDVAVDVRRGSPNYGSWVAEELSYENGVQLWIPSGFLHGFMTLEPDSEIIYKCTDHYSPQHDGAVRWDSCGIDWPLVGNSPLLSEKDQDAPPFSDFTSPFTYKDVT